MGMEKPVLDFESTFFVLEKLVKESNFSEFQNRLRKIKKIPRAFIAKIADLSIRSGQPLWALNRLHKWVHLDDVVNTDAPRSELLSYAYALYVLGSTQSARKILSHPRFKDDPVALQHVANSYIHEWNYSVAAEYLMKLLDLPILESTPYQVYVRKTNLVACLISCSRFEEAKPMLEEIKIFCEKHNHKLLLGNIFELYGQFFFFQKKKNLARENFLKSLATFEDQDSVYALFARKWLLITRMADGEDSPILQEELDQIIARSTQLELWDVRRDLDFFKGCYFNDSIILQHVMSGSISHYLETRKNFLELRIFPPKVLDFFPETVKSSKVFSTVTINLEMSSGLRNIFFALVSDFYSPIKLGRLFELAYPDEVFSPKTSPARVIKSMERLNAYFVQNNLPVRVQFNRSNFKLIALDSCKLQFAHPLFENQSGGAIVRALSSQFGFNPFSTQEAARALGKSTSTTQRLLKSAVSAGKIAVSGNSRSTLYCIVLVKDQVAA